MKLQCVTKQSENWKGLRKEGRKEEEQGREGGRELTIHGGD